jgi:hypothetical protein
LIVAAMFLLAVAWASDQDQHDELRSTTATAAVADPGDREEPATSSTDEAATSATETTPSVAASTTVSSSVTRPPAGELVLRSDGLGIASLGQPAESAIALVTEAVGAQPTADDTVTGAIR